MSSSDKTDHKKQCDEENHEDTHNTEDEQPRLRVVGVAFTADTLVVDAVQKNASLRFGNIEGFGCSEHRPILSECVVAVQETVHGSARQLSSATPRDIDFRQGTPLLVATQPSLIQRSIDGVYLVHSGLSGDLSLRYAGVDTQCILVRPPDEEILVSIGEIRPVGVFEGGDCILVSEDLE